VEQLAAGLVALGVRPGQRVALASGTRLEWILANLAVMLAGAVSTYVRRYAVLPGRHAVVFTNNDAGYDAALALKGASEELKTKILGNLSQRAASMLQLSRTPLLPSHTSVAGDSV